MESLHQNLLRFFISFIASRTTESSSSPSLIKKIMQMKPVQKIIIDSMCKIDPIINQEILASTNYRLSQQQRFVLKKSKLLTLADDVKIMMENYEDIQIKVSSVRDIVDSLDLAIESYPSPEESSKTPVAGAAYSFLSEAIGVRQITDEEIEEISGDIWGKHMEVEKMLQAELQKYKDEKDSVVSRHHYRLYEVKTKTGLRILDLEAEIARNTLFFQEKISRISMQIEDIMSTEHERYQAEEQFLRFSSDYSYIKDLPTAIQKIKNLVTAKNIYEKRMLQDEKLIKGLNNKLKQILDKFTDLQNTNSKLLANFSSLNWCLGTVLERSDLPQAIKDKSLKYISKQKCVKLEELLRAAGTFDLASIDFVNKKFEDFKEGISHITALIKDDNAKTKINKLILESKSVQIKRSVSPKRLRHAVILKKNSRARTAKGADRNKINEEGTVEQLKQALMSIDEAMRHRTRVIGDDLEELAMEMDSDMQGTYEESTKVMDAQEIDKKKTVQALQSPRKPSYNISPRSPAPKNEPARTATEVERNVNCFEHRFVQTNNCICKEQYAQTDLQMHNQSFKNILDSKNETNKRFMLRDQDHSILQDLSLKTLDRKPGKYEEKGAQTEHQSLYFEFKTPDNTIIREIMNKARQNQSRERTFPKASDLPVEAPIFSIKDGLSQANKIDTLASNSLLSNQNHYLKEASKEYQREFQLQVQIKGLKKLEPNDVRIIWEEVINRRITDGEKDKISIYLRGYLGTDKYEEEKKKVISIIEASKSAEISTATKVLPKSLFTVRNEIGFKNWKKLMDAFFGKYFLTLIGNIDDKCTFTDILYRAARKIKYVRHRLEKVKVCKKIEILGKKSEENLRYKTDQWTVNSLTPTLLETNSAKIRYKSARRFKPDKRVKTSNHFNKERSLLHDIAKLPII